MTKISFFLLILFIFSFIIAPEPARALTQTQEALLLQQGKETSPPLPIFAIAQLIEVLQQEIRLLQSLLLNMQPQQEISAASYLAMNLSDNSVILSKNANQSYPIASITKLMTAVIASEHIEKNRTIQLTEKMLEPLGRSPSLFPGLNVGAENLLKASLIQSTNDASEALAYFLEVAEASPHLPPSSAPPRTAKEKFLNLMNEKAKELGMGNTVFSDVHGLNPDNRSTAADLAKLVAYIYEQHPEILSATRDNNFWLPDATGWLLKFQNVNNFYPFSSFVGGKTGYLPEAKQTLASVFRVEEEPIAIILLYSDNRQADTFTILNQLKK